MSGVQPSLSNHLGLQKYDSTYVARVDLELFVDNGHAGQPSYPVAILAPRPIQNLFWSSTLYHLSIEDGHALSPTGIQNRIDIQIKKRDSTPAANKITFCLPLDGKPLVSDDGFSTYVAAVTGGGPAIFRNPGVPYPSNVSFTDKDNPEATFAVMITRRDVGGDTTITVTPAQTTGGGVDLLFQLEDAELIVTSFASGTVVANGAPYTFTFNRQTSAQAIIDARYAAAFPETDPEDYPDYSPAFSSLLVTSLEGPGNFTFGADSQYPFTYRYRLEPPDNEYNGGPYRSDLHFGNEDDADPGLPAADRWLRHKIIAMDVTLQRAVRLTAGPVQKRAHFQTQG